MLRIISSIIGLPLVIFLVNQGGAWLLVGIAFITLFALNEFFRVFDMKNKYLTTTSYIFSIIYIYALSVSIDLYSVLVSFLLSILIIMVMTRRDINIDACLIAIFSFFYITFLLSFIYLVRQSVRGEDFVWLIFISSWGCDTGAFYFGKVFGKYKLTDISPNKTVEGSIGGIFSATLFGFIYSYIRIGTEPKLIFYVCTIVAICSVFAQLGDLVASTMKRKMGVKDFGSVILGHGGFIDRFDSVLFAAPFIYVILKIAINIV
jgi:phosphatidate cytidylyltransferase